MTDAKTAAALIIGNELLSGKTQEGNLAFLARMLRSLGIRLRRVVMTLDDIDDIASDVVTLSQSFDWLFTSGGVGPTHDDVTIDAVAKAFQVPVISDPSMETLLRSFYKERCTDAHLRMARIPKGATLETTAEMTWPTVRLHNTWLLPGVPEIFRMKLPVIIAKLGKHPAFVSRAVYTKMDEGDLKPLLDAIVAAYPDIDVGSYPKWFDSSYKTKLTFDGQDQTRVVAARDAFVTLLPAGEPQRLD